MRTLFLLVFTWMGGLQAGCHEENQQIFAIVLEEEIDQLQGMTSEAKAEYLLKNIDGITEAAKNRGFDASVYQYKKSLVTGYLYFTRHPLWQGDFYDIPLTFYAYQWPPEKEALKQGQGRDHQLNCYYRSNIHAHSIACAMTIVSGSVTQIYYEEVANHPERAVVEIGRDVFYSGDTVIDDNSTPFIHQVICQHEGPDPAISVHGYGAKTAAEVEKIFIESSADYSFRNVLKEDGSIEQQPW